MNKHLFSKLSIGVAAVICAVNLTAVTAHADGFTPTWPPSGLDKIISGYRPQSVALSTKQPRSLKVLPDGATGATMGTIKTGTGPTTVNHAILLEMANGSLGRLCLDCNGDGTITPDEIFNWTITSAEAPSGKMITNYLCRATIQVTTDGKLGELEFYLASNDKSFSNGSGPKLIFYHNCYGVTGTINLDGQTVPAALEDSGGFGEFSLTNGAFDAPLGWVGVTNRSKRGEMFSVNRPVEVNGKWWIITNLTAAGNFEFAPTTKPVPKVVKHVGPDLSPGKKAPVFTAKTLDGKTVNFPADYKGKVVLLDFWATWCGPCMGEVPNVVNNYAKYHSQGFEILGVTLDKEDATAQINKVMTKKDMTWPQIYDGKYWQAAIAKLYGINAIPHALLVDGDTGVILADKDIRGDQLSPAIEKALAAKKK
jgi:peroxiredoxin